MRYILFIILFLFNFLSAEKIVRQKLMLMGSNFEITVVAQNAKQGNNYINLAISEINRVSDLISSWKQSSQTTKINKNAGIKPVKVSPELFDLIVRAKQISQITQGAFDISFAPLSSVWKFDGSMNKLPEEEAVEKKLKKVDYKKIVLDSASRTVFLKEEKMKIGFGAIGKGYAADKAKDLLVNKGVTAGLINASGDLTTWGEKPDGSPWKVAIVNPLNKANSFGKLCLRNKAIATSGDYEKFVKINGQRYSHIIDPRTGYPTQSGLTSVSIVAPKAELADALATAIFVVGKETGLNIINQLPQVEAVLIDKKGKLYKSKNSNIDRLKR